MKFSKKNKIKELKKKIYGYNYLYYVLDSSQINDNQYEYIIFKLKSLEDSILINSKSSIDNIGFFSNSHLECIKHKIPMLSLQSIFNIETLKNFDNFINKILITHRLKNIKIFNEYICEVKLDGLAVNLTYEKGILISAITRGNGLNGENILNNILNIKYIPLNLKYKTPHFLNIRGEIFIDKKDFKNINQKFEKNTKKFFFSPRNFVSGNLRLVKDNNIIINKKLNFFAHGWGEIKFFNYQKLISINIFKKKNNYIETLSWINEFGIPINKNYRKKTYGLTGLIKFFSKIEIIKSRIPFFIDGVVYKINNLFYQKKIGCVSNSPRYSVSHKYVSKKVITKLKNVFLKVGRTGLIIPTAYLEPVFLNGTKINKANLYNEENIIKKNLKVGDIVIIHQSGDIIPELMKSINYLRKKKNKKIFIPTRCIFCNSSINKILYNSFLYCTGNYLCVNQRKMSLFYASYRNSLNFSGLGKKIISDLINFNRLKTISDFYTLSYLELTECYNLNFKIIKKIIYSINISKKLNLKSFILSFGIKYVGFEVSGELSKYFKNILSIINANKKSFLNISNIKTLISNYIIKFLSKKNNQDIINKLVKFGIETLNVLKIRSNLIYNFTFTGILLKSKKEKIKKKIFKFKGNNFFIVFCKIDYLIMGKNPNLKKIKKAKHLGLNIIKELDFYKKFVYFLNCI